MPKYTTRCNIPILDEDGKPIRLCGMEIVVTPGIKVPELGGEPDPKTKAFVQAIVGHMMKKHPAVAAASMNMMEQFLSYSVVGLTQCEDPGAVQFMASFAAYLCQLSTLPVTDEMIEELVKRILSRPEVMEPMSDTSIAELRKALTYIRNFQIRKISLQSPANSPEPSPVAP
jgi:hypothetical protein